MIPSSDSSKSPFRMIGPRSRNTPTSEPSSNCVLKRALTRFSKVNSICKTGKPVEILFISFIIFKTRNSVEPWAVRMPAHRLITDHQHELDRSVNRPQSQADNHSIACLFSGRYDNFQPVQSST